ncbi:acetate--CoA ligase family protein [Falsiroseomonas sp. CW058]|uniref:acetate--CoA ligase family protein n=1 Tax=Falsiroseomonas sp. CW058 TaxID=3388664 RepID=UPI003D31D3CD
MPEGGTRAAADPAAGPRDALDEAAAKRLLAAHGIAVPRSAVISAGGDPAAALAGLSPPFALKVMAPGLLHKSDAGGVRLRLPDAAAVRAARDAMLASPVIAAHAPQAFLVEEMAPPGHEVVVGGMVDARFGPVVMLGLGGIFVEVFADIAFRICPIRRHEARDMLEELKALPVLRGARGGVAADEDAICDVLLRLGGAGGLMADPALGIREIDINPLIVSAAGAVAADARILLGAPR